MVNGIKYVKPLVQSFKYHHGAHELVLPMERSLHVTEGVAKHAKTSSVQVKCVRWGSTIDWPLHWPHMYTWPLWVLAADVCVEWQAAISTILSKKPEERTEQCTRQREEGLLHLRWWSRSPLFLSHDLNWAQLVALVAGAQLSVCVGTPSVKQPLVC